MMVFFLVKVKEVVLRAGDECGQVWGSLSPAGGRCDLKTVHIGLSRASAHY